MKAIKEMKIMDAGDQENFEISSFLGAPKLSTIYGHKKNTAGGSWVAGSIGTRRWFL